MSLPPSVPSSSEDASFHTVSTSSKERAAETNTFDKFSHRRLRGAVLKKKVPVDVLTKTIQLYNLELSYDKQPAEVMDEVERMLGMEGIEWPFGPKERLQMISAKLEHELKRVLKSYGYAFPFSSCSIMSC